MPRRRKDLTLAEVREKRSFRKKVKKDNDTKLISSSSPSIPDRSAEINAKIATAKALTAILKSL